MSDLEKANVLNALEKNFSVPKEVLNKLLQQISDENIKKNYERIKRGLKTEENYKSIFSALPWIKNIHGLHQEQEHQHKENYQTPDFSLLIENSDHLNFPILVDVKSVSGQKESCEIIPKQLHALRAYAADHKIPLVFAIYWERIGYWTHTSAKCFSGKKHNKITWRQAIQNDLSHILSDYCYLVNEVFYRRTIFSKIEPATPSAGNAQRGYFSKIFVGTELNNLNEYGIITSSAIDSIFKSRVISKNKISEHEFEVTEIFDHFRFVKLSNWLVNFVNIWGFSPDQKFGDMRATLTARHSMVDLMLDLGFHPVYPIPTQKNTETEKLFKMAYDGTPVMRMYYSSE